MAGLLVILSGPGGVGKDTVLNAWMSSDPRIVRVIACTTRPKREKEVNGVDYHFLTLDEFEHRLEEGAFLEAKLVYGNWYATPISQVEELLARGNVAVLKIDVQGALTVMEKRPEALSIFILPPNFDELKRRLRADKGTRTAEDIERRIEHAELEMGLADRYRFQVVNDDVPRCVQEIRRIVKGAFIEEAV